VGHAFLPLAGLMPADLASSELLRAIVRRPADAQRIARLAENVRDWDSLLHLAREHRVSPMLFSRLGDMGPVVPPAVQEQLRAEYQRNVFHNLANAKELIGLLHVLDREGIPAMPFKGVVLGASIYGDLTAPGASHSRSAGNGLRTHNAGAREWRAGRSAPLRIPFRAAGGRNGD